MSLVYVNFRSLLLSYPLQVPLITLNFHYRPHFNKSFEGQVLLSFEFSSLSDSLTQESIHHGRFISRPIITHNKRQSYWAIFSLYLDWSSTQPLIDSGLASYF